MQEAEHPEKGAQNPKTLLTRAFYEASTTFPGEAGLQGIYILKWWKEHAITFSLADAFAELLADKPRIERLVNLANFRHGEAKSAAVTDPDSMRVILNAELKIVKTLEPLAADELEWLLEREWQHTPSSQITLGEVRSLLRDRQFPKE
jgi:hypothetical protein